ncbi:hypothetical protein QBC37DRAFT_382384 [Rhypophila decipiens]|uniref:Uncharacterized protein n=1 Tax=Rhypophila decipiens TaxID=261697 RepID=A0AAN6YNS2_9PEZI|nr:hypothetical protein QBC37DRAFT_382384 [Rhypophila decipiens]
MFRGTPPFLRVILRHRKWAILAAPLATLTFLYGSYHPEFYQFSPPVEPDDPPPVSRFQHDPLVVQADLSEFPDYYWAITGQTLDSNNDKSSEDQPETDPLQPLSLLFTTSEPQAEISSSEDDFPLPPPPQPPTFTPGIPKPLNEAYTKAIIIAHTKFEQVTWINDPLLNSPPPPYPKQAHRTNTTNWTSYLYSTDDLSPPTIFKPNQHHLHTPLNKGRESLAYLSYIIAQYDSLPDISVFMHAHSSSWHDDQFGLDSRTSLSRLNLDRVVVQGYVNLRCWWDPGCPDHIHPFASETDDLVPEERIFRDAWLDIFPWRDIPPSISHTCCSQFALSKERIRAVRLSEYVRLRDWILGTDLEDSVSGRVFEYIWQVVWTGYEILCPVEWVCYCMGYGICFGKGLKKIDGKEEEQEEERNQRGYEEYSVKRDEWTDLNRIVEEFLESEDGFEDGFRMEDIESFVDRVENGEKVDEVVWLESSWDGEADESGKDDAEVDKKEGIGRHERSRTDTDTNEEDLDLAQRLADVIVASRKANKELLPWLMDRMKRAKGEI